MSKKLIISLSILITIIIISTWAFIVSSSLTKNVTKVNDTDDAISDENASVNELILTESKDGKKFWELYAVSGDYDSSNSQVNLKNVKGNFYKNNKVALSFDAPSAKYFDKTKEVILIGERSKPARAATSNDFLVTANRLCWKGKKEEVSAKGNVKIRKSSDLLATGEESVFSIKLSRITMIGRVNTRLLKSSK